MQYLKHYWTDESGNYQTVKNKSVGRQHPSIEGLSVKYWLTDERGIDYCLSVCPDTTLVNVPPAGIEVLTEQQYDTLVSAIPNPEQSQIEPINWNYFREQLSKSQDFNSLLSQAVTLVPQAVANIPSAAYKLDNGNFTDFMTSWQSIAEVVQISEEFRTGLVQLATACNIPQQFIDFINVDYYITPEPEEVPVE